MIRHALSADRPHMVRMGEEFLRVSGLPMTFDAGWAAHSLAVHMSDQERLSLVLDLPAGVSGMLCAGCVMSPLVPKKVATELVFWIDADARGPWAQKMIAAYEDWAKRQGCQFVSLAAIGERGADILYRRCGYVAAERHYMKELC